MWQRRFPRACFVLLLAITWSGFVHPEECPSRDATMCERGTCGRFKIRRHSMAWSKSRNALLEIPFSTACDTEEIFLSELGVVRLGNVNGSYLWRIPYKSLLGASNSSHVLFSTLKEPLVLKDRKAIDSNLRILSYVSQRVAMQFSTKPVKPSVHTVNITFNVSGDREIEGFSLKRIWLIAHTAKLYCAKWNGKWTQNGCRTVNSSLLGVKCECTFTDVDRVMKMGVLTEVKSLPDSRPAMPLYVAMTSISTLFFALTLVMLIRFRKALKDPNRRFEVQINLSVSLLLRHTFLFSGFAISLFDPLNRKGCEAVAVLHAYFLITSVLWVLIEGIIVYRKVCRSLMSMPLSTLVTSAVLVWGLPFLLLAGVSSYELVNERFIQHAESFRVIKYRLESVYSDPNIVSRELANYRKYDFCWTTSNISSFSMGIPVTISLIVNTIILVWVGVVVWKIRVADSKNIPSGSGKRHSGSVEQTRSTFRAVVLLTAMLGIPWLLSLFYNLLEGIVKKDNLAPSYIHFACIFLQGPALFYLYCVHNHEFRRAFQRSVDTHYLKKDVGSQQHSSQHH